MRASRPRVFRDDGTSECERDRRIAAENRETLLISIPREPTFHPRTAIVRLICDSVRESHDKRDD